MSSGQIMKAKDKPYGASKTPGKVPTCLSPGLPSLLPQQGPPSALADWWGLSGPSPHPTTENVNEEGRD